MGKVLNFVYINWQGEVAVRWVEPEEIFYGSTEYHPKSQWLLKGFDIEKQQNRTFAMKDIIKFL